MDELEDLERRVANLTPAALAQFRRWFAEFDAGLWDRQMEQHAAEGKLDELARKALQDHRAGRTRPL